MTKIQILICMIIFTLGTVGVLAQNNSDVFIHSKNVGDRRIVYFDIQGIGADIDAHDMVLERFFQDPNIFDGNITTKDNNNAFCRLEVSQTVSLEYLQVILDDFGYTLDVESINRRKALDKNKKYYSEYIPVFGDFIDWEEFRTGNLQMTREEFYNEKKLEWISKNPSKYDETVKQNGSSVIVFKKDFDEFSPEKQEFILSQPEIFIIEE
jgi:hypothetical protein